jgi:hypothetical protein
VATPVTPGAFAVDPVVPQDLYLASVTGSSPGTTGFLRSMDGGATWTAAAGDIAKAALAGILVAPNSPGTLYAFGEIPGGYYSIPPAMPRLYTSIDRGVTWTQLQGGLAGVPPGFVSSMVIDPATSALYVVAGGDVQKSVDGGLTWSVIYQPPDLINNELGNLGLAPGQPSTLYAVHAGVVLASTDGGATWQTIAAAGQSGPVALLTVDPQNPQHLLAQIDEGGLQDLTRAAPVPCAAGPTAACLAGGRFQVEASWSTGPTSGAGQAVALTPDTAYFWFFAASNLELVVKVLDGCALNGNYWVFAGGLTDVLVNLRVTDSLSGYVEIYANPAGTPFPQVQDTAAFAACP